MKKTVIINAGHSKNDPGAVFGPHIEKDFTITIRTGVSVLLKEQGFKVLEVPDTLNLTQSIDWVNANSNSLNDGLAFSIHLNAGGGRGAESFFFTGSRTSQTLAEALIGTYCRYTGLASRGAKPDSQARWGGLSWIKRTRTWAILIEAAFIDSLSDMTYIVDNMKEVVEAIARGVCAMYKINYIEKPAENNNTEKIKKQITEHADEIKRLTNLI